jgi:hypothetical protein
MKSNVLIVSHRRSGTHLLIDAIINNFSSFSNSKRPYRSLDFLEKNFLDQNLFAKLRKDLLDRDPVLFKSHSHQDFSEFYNNLNKFPWMKELFLNSKIIYVFREPKNVLLSLFHHLRKQESYITDNFSLFIRQLNHYHSLSYIGEKTYVEYWNFHCTSWINEKILFVSFEQMLKNYVSTLKSVETYIQSELDKNIIDVRKKFKPENGIKITSMNPRLGDNDDCKSIFLNRDCKLIDDLTLETYHKLQSKLVE